MLCYVFVARAIHNNKSARSEIHYVRREVPVENVSFGTESSEVALIQNPPFTIGRFLRQLISMEHRLVGAKGVRISQILAYGRQIATNSVMNNQCD